MAEKRKKKKQRLVLGKDSNWEGSVWGQYGDVSTLEVRGQHFTCIRQQSVKSMESSVCASHGRGHIYYMVCLHNTSFKPRWQGLKSALKKKSENLLWVVKGK